MIRYLRNIGIKYLTSKIFIVGGETYYSGGFAYHIFKNYNGSSSQFITTARIQSASVLIVGGGGGTYSDGPVSVGGGAGGGGAIVLHTELSVGTYNIRVGSGSVPVLAGLKDFGGQSSSFGTSSVLGGSNGGFYWSGNKITASISRGPYAAGGGGVGPKSVSPASEASGTYGTIGGDGGNVEYVWDPDAMPVPALTEVGGGGGGMGSDAHDSRIDGYSHGGNGVFFSEFATLGLGSPSGYFGGGGGSANIYGHFYSSGGLGGGGKYTEEGVDFTGGGAGSTHGVPIGNREGGHGIVVVKYPSKIKFLK